MRRDANYLLIAPEEGSHLLGCSRRSRSLVYQQLTFPPPSDGGGLGRGPLLLFLSFILLATTNIASAASYTFIVSGLGGEPQYEERFRKHADEIAAIAISSASSPEHVVKLSGEQADRESIRREFKSLAERVTAQDAVSVVLIGHGTYDGEEYRFNIPGPDITGTELQRLLGTLQAREQLIVNTTSASGATADKWARPGRVLITATKSGGERTATRFAEYWAEALKDAKADSNKDEVVTAGEAFAYASEQVAAAFKADVSLATEHARIEGNDLAAKFTVARQGAAVLSTDPEVQALLAQRAGLEQTLSEIKERRGTLDDDGYYDALEGVLVQFARLQQQIDAKQTAQAGAQ